jgi:serine/threonine-protein kinase
VVKVADFGLVRAMASSGTTSSSIILGTVAYLAPEQVTTGMAGASGDVYSAGIVLYEMLTGQAPYTGDTAISVAYRHVNDDVPAPSTRVPGIPAALDELVLRATRRDPEGRPADAGAFLWELRQVRGSLGLGPAAIPVPPRKADRAPDTERTVPAFAPVSGTSPISGPRGTRAIPRLGPPTLAVAPPQLPPVPPPTAGKPRRPVVLWSIVGLVLVVLLGGGLWWFTTGQRASNTASVPQIAGMDRATAEKTLNDSGFPAKFTEQRSNTMGAGLAIRTDPAAGSGALRGTEVTVVLSSGRPTVPDIGSDTSLAQAETAIMAAQLVPVHNAGADQYSATVAEGNVVSVSPQPGTQLDIGAQVVIVLSKGPAPQPVPDVTGMSHDQAFQTLRAHGFDPFDAGTDFSQNVPAGYVTRTSPAANSQVQGNSKRVGVYVSNAVSVPSVVGRSIQEAQQILQQAGLQVDLKGHDRGFGLVIQQDPNPGQLVKTGSRVTLLTIP